MQYTLNTPLTKDKLQNLKAGDYVCLSGTIYSARDAAHLRMHQALAESGALPIPLADAAIYYMGPLPPGTLTLWGLPGHCFPNVSRSPRLLPTRICVQRQSASSL